MAHSQASEPYIQYAYQLLERIADGSLRIAQFQRELVWEWDRKQNLLRSVRDGIPMGAVMEWWTDTPVASLEELAGHPLPAPDRPPYCYLLDGFQRLSTLFSALRGVHGKEAGRPVYYSMKDLDFVELEEAQLPLATAGPLIPMSALLSSVELLKIQRTLSSDDHVRALDDLARRFREYKVPVIPISSNDLAHVTRTFQLINSTGVRMAETDMVHALTWSPGFGLRSRMEDLKQEKLAELGWGEVSNDVLLKVLKAKCGIPLYDLPGSSKLERDPATRLAEALRDEPERIEHAVESVARAARILARRCGVLSPGLLPYELQLVMCALVVSEDISAEQEQLLEDWFWLSTCGELFGGLSGLRVQRALDDLVEGMAEGILCWSGPRPLRLRPFPQNAHLRGARAKGIALRLALTRAEVEGDEALDALARDGYQAFTQGLSKDETSDLNGSFGNRFFVTRRERGTFRQRLRCGMFSPEERQAHAIEDAAWALLRKNDWRGFVERRAATLERKEREMVESLRKKLADDLAPDWL